MSAALDEGGSRRILIVDDEAPIVRMVQRVLAGERLESDGSGEAALERLERDQGYDVVLCDLMMSGMSGLDLHEAVRSRWPALADRFVFITGGVLDPDDDEALAALPNPCVYKPFRPDDLRAAVRLVSP